MPDYHRQHYLPVVYLKEFASDGGRLGRKSRIWRCDATRNLQVAVVSQGVDKFFYSKEQAATVEKMFGGMESFYGGCLNTIRAGKPLQTADSYGLILMMADLHLRSASYSNLTGQDNFHAYRTRIHGFKQMLMGKEQEQVSITDKQFADYLVKYWRVGLLPCPRPTGPLITSDNPAVFFSSERPKPGLSVILLPLAPDCLAVAYDRRIYRTKKETLDDVDAGALNHIQCKSAIHCVYSFCQLGPENEEDVRHIFANRPPEHRGISGNERIHVPLFRTSTDWRLSFLSDEAPLM